MIGLGSNRLTVCRRGGMSVTQAGKGGMEWLAGGRMPSWASPYSSQATAALKAQFPTQWPTIRDYGFAHPEIVGYMNAYASEDAKIAYSLVEGIGSRELVGTGSAYIATGIKTTSNMSLETYIRPHSDDISSRRYLIGGNVAWGAFLLRFYNNGFMWHYGISGGDHQVGTPVVDTLYKITAGVRTIAVDGVSWTATNATTPQANQTLNIFKSGNMNDLYSKAGFGRTKIWDGSTLLLDYCPFIRNEVCGFIDLVSGDFKTPTGGSMTISESPS